mmetsp:Transcript_12289/g.11865  ORF Transcript_12289/g.11865 Transcript_12289/m.11865 type:complete len:85 (-) Transcript_12289:35-289(-)
MGRRWRVAKTEEAASVSTCEMAIIGQTKKTGLDGVIKVGKNWEKSAFDVVPTNRVNTDDNVAGPAISILLPLFIIIDAIDINPK